MLLHRPLFVSPFPSLLSHGPQTTSSFGDIIRDGPLPLMLSLRQWLRARPCSLTLSLFFSPHSSALARPRVCSRTHTHREYVTQLGLVRLPWPGSQRQKLTGPFVSALELKIKAGGGRESLASFAPALAIRYTAVWGIRAPFFCTRKSACIYAHTHAHTHSRLRGTGTVNPKWTRMGKTSERGRPQCPLARAQAASSTKPPPHDGTVVSYYVTHRQTHARTWKVLLRLSRLCDRTPELHRCRSCGLYFMRVAEPVM